MYNLHYIIDYLITKHIQCGYRSNHHKWKECTIFYISTFRSIIFINNSKFICGLCIINLYKEEIFLSHNYHIFTTTNPFMANLYQVVSSYLWMHLLEIFL